jgi:hypothetical protein
MVGNVQITCHITTGSYTTCVFDSGSPPCGNTQTYTCSGVTNSRADCTGMDQMTTCNNPVFACR